MNGSQDENSISNSQTAQPSERVSETVTSHGALSGLTSSRLQLQEASERLRSSFTKLRRRLKQTPTFTLPARLAQVPRTKLTIRVTISNDLSRYSIVPELNETKTQKLLPFALERLTTDVKSGIAMLGKTPVRFAKPSEFTWLEFLKEDPWQDLPIESLEEWIEYLFEIPVRPRLAWDDTSQECDLAWREVSPTPILKFELSRNSREGASLTRGTTRVVPIFKYPNFEITLNDRASHEILRDSRTIELRNRKLEEAALLELFQENATAQEVVPPKVDGSSKFQFIEIQRERRKINRLEVPGEHLRSLLDTLMVRTAEPRSGPTSEDTSPHVSNSALQLAPSNEILKLQGRRLLPMKDMQLVITSATAGVLVSGVVDFEEFQIPIQDLLPRLDLAIGTVERQSAQILPVTVSTQASVSLVPIQEALKDKPQLSLNESSAHLADSQENPCDELNVSASDSLQEPNEENARPELGFLTPRALARLTALLSLGTETKTGVRFALAQLPILAALFAGDSINQTLPSTSGKIETRMDAPFRAMVEKFIAHREAKPKPPPASFKGTLRHYQEEGFGWLSFLADTGFGGILADDMGLGKTVQLIAHLTDQYVKNPKAPLSLVVLPKSLLFNWEEEIRKFSPGLKCAIYEGSQKRPLFSQIRGLNVLLVTYNTLRQDIEALSQVPYHFVILDEAQAIKNASSQVHKACLQLKARHRLAVSGTPVENSVMDLFAIFDFVSPGLLSGRLKQKALQLSMQANGNLAALGLALKPFILRRTKEEVLKDLPPKVEKVIHCKLAGAELKRYQAIRDFHKKRVQDAVASQGLTKSGFAVLEGLLRLRQAASHPGLVDKKWIDEPSAKLDAFMEQLQTVLDSGHKALVFSQFTGLLDIVEKKLERAGINQLRIDGSYSSAQRRESVHEFQSNDKVEVFLISLKAGGTGLNLTAAGYVFILDPWWNPAAESQAIDRAHRMGQKNRVFAYRMITKGTVEEKILELQKTKRDLASALVSSDAGMLKTLSHEDIEALFS